MAETEKIKDTAENLINEDDLADVSGGMFVNRTTGQKDAVLRTELIFREDDRNVAVTAKSADKMDLNTGNEVLFVPLTKSTKRR